MSRFILSEGVNAFNAWDMVIQLLSLNRMKDLNSKEDVKIFVDAFYSKVKEDSLIGPIFIEKVGEENWDSHLEIMYSFWNTVLFTVPDYRGNSFKHHTSLGLKKDHFDRWTLLTEESVKENFEGPNAEALLGHANTMRQLFESKLKYFDENPEMRPPSQT